MVDKYIDVVAGVLYLKKIFASIGVTVDNLDLTPEEIAYAETWAENRIESRLGVVFAMTPATPLLIADIALALASYKLRQFLLTANAPNLDDWTIDLKKEADELIEDIFHGRRSVIMPDGSFHPRYPGPSDGKRFAEQEETALRRFFINMDKPFLAMEQSREDTVGEPGIEQEFHDNVHHEDGVGSHHHEKAGS